MKCTPVWQSWEVGAPCMCGLGTVAPTLPESLACDLAPSAVLPAAAVGAQQQDRPLGLQLGVLGENTLRELLLPYQYWDNRWSPGPQKLHKHLHIALNQF